MDNSNDSVVELAHGSGGRASNALIEEVFYPYFDNHYLAQQSDQAILPQLTGRPVFATDSHVVSPLVFPGGDIGTLAVYGTVNDIALSGAKPLYISAGFIIEEGLKLSVLKSIAKSMALAARAACVTIVTGDTKVVGKGQADGLYINTSGIGDLSPAWQLSPKNVRPNQKIIVSGSLGDHAIAIMAQRESLRLDSPIISDTAPLTSLIKMMLTAAPGISAMRDPTRGGLSATLHEIARSAQCGIQIDESTLPIRKEVRGVCELFGLDPLSLANEGKLVAFCPVEQCQALLSAMHQHPQGKDAAIIGEVTADPQMFVSVTTAYGGSRRLPWQWSDPLPRIC